MDKLFKISDLAKFLGITTATIRYYESYGLLSPAYVDDETQYRYYGYKEVNRLAGINDLRNAGLSMQEVKQYLDQSLPTSELITFLGTRIKELNSIQRRLQIGETKAGFTPVEFATTPPFYFIENETQIASQDELNDVVEKQSYYIITNYTMTHKSIMYAHFSSVFAELRLSKPVGIGFFVKDKQTDTVKNLGLNGVRTYFRGRYENLSIPYKALRDFARDNCVELSGETYEVYYENSDVHANNTDDYLTEILMTIKK